MPAKTPRVIADIRGEGELAVPLSSLFLGTDDQDVIAVWNMLQAGSRRFVPLCVRRDDGLVLMTGARPA